MSLNKRGAMEKKTDLRVEKTYLLLHNAFTELLEKKRFEGITVNELCEKAMIRRTTFYKHFADKYEYFAFYMKEISMEFRNQLPPDAETDEVNGYFFYMCRELLRFIDAHENLIQNVVSSNMFSVVLDCLSEQITYNLLDVMCKTKGADYIEMNQMEDIAAFYTGGLFNMLRLSLKKGRKMEEEYFSEVISKVLSYGNM